VVVIFVFRDVVWAAAPAKGYNGSFNASASISAAPRENHLTK
jgi:hypothetical protein